MKKNKTMVNLKDHKDLIGILLGPLRERPSMFIEEAKISKLPNFINGYRTGFLMASDTNYVTDRFFENPGFINWFFDKYKVESPVFEGAFLKEAKDDDAKALQLFFTYLEEYSKEISSGKP